MKKCIILMNKNSGKKKKVNYDAITDLLKKEGYDTQIKFTTYKGNSVDIVSTLPDDIDLVISAGGDGTLNEVVTGNMKRKNPLIIGNWMHNCV